MVKKGIVKMELEIDIEMGKNLESDFVDEIHGPTTIRIIVDELTGARVGLVVSKGHEENAYFEGKSENPVLYSIVAKEMTIGIGEEINVIKATTGALA